MCNKCDEIDVKMMRYKRIASQIDDQVLQAGLAELLEKMLAEKASFHAEQSRK
ncbi:hypothetical protein [Bradyrhizobium roseum]|uniref:hypothetical protein n=1 Tax=Bradyrhizobium roseum TaxID=3056648 RepID=UPI00261712CC|nr:hypothetical protein [Bradyrhizobium roseus]WKA25867.1 hypothetical protein QUH67_19795 [Bradyrhizobium roseus]